MSGLSQQQYESLAERARTARNHPTDMVGLTKNFASDLEESQDINDKAWGVDLRSLTGEGQSQITLEDELARVIRYLERRARQTPQGGRRKTRRARKVRKTRKLRRGKNGFRIR